jgi:hypothetical protein
MSGTYAGIGGCPHCGLQVLFAVGVTGELVALDEGENGPVVVSEDCTGTPRVRRAAAFCRPGEGERRCGVHNAACIGLAPVIPLTVRARLRQTGANRRLA